MIERFAPLLMSLIGKDFGVTVRRVKRNSLLYLVAGVFLLTAYIAAVAGFFLVLADRYGDIAAMFALAIGALVLAIAVMIAVILVDRADRRMAKPPVVGSGLLAIGAASFLPMILKSRVLTSVLTLGVIAFLASRGSPGAGDDPAP